MDKSPAERVRAQLTLAREIARDAFHEPSEETVMAVFHRLCVEADMVEPEGYPEPVGVAVH